MGRTLIAGLIVGMMLCAPVLAERLDDSLSPRQQHNLQLEWKHRDDLEGKHIDQLTQVVATARNVDTRLDTSAYVDQQARIYLELPIQVRGLANPASLELSWTTNGLFNSGSVTPGTRQLIFEGRVPEPVMRDIFNFTFEVDARHLYQSLRLEPIYEIEVVTP